MSDPAAIAVAMLRAELRQRRTSPILPRLWLLMRDEWQRLWDRTTAHGLAAAIPARAGSVIGPRTR